MNRDKSSQLLNLATGVCAAATEEKKGQMTLSDLIHESMFPGIKEVEDLISASDGLKVSCIMW